MRQLNNKQFDTKEGASASLSEIVSSQFAPSVSQKDEIMTQDNLIKEVKNAITWLCEVAEINRTDLKHGLVDRAKRLSDAIDEDIDERFKDLLYRPINKDMARVIKASARDEIWKRPNAWQKIGGK